MGRIERKKYQFGQYSLSYRIMIIFLLIGMIFTGIVFLFLYYEEKDSIQSEYFISQQYGEEALINAVQLADQSFSLYDNVFNQPLRLGLLRFNEFYNKSNQKPQNMNLEQIRNELSSYFDLPVDLYIINSSNIVQYSTFEPDIGLDFSIYPKFNDKLSEIREGDSIAYDSIVTGTNLGEERKYAYIPTSDHEYILEIGVNLDDFFRKEGISKYPRLASWYNNTRNDVLSVWIFDQTSLTSPDIKLSIQGFEVYPYHYKEFAGRKDYLNQVFTKRESMLIDDPDSGTIIKYVYIPQIRSSSVSSGLFDKVAEITYSTTFLKEKENQIFFQISVLAIAVILILVIIAVAISRYISHPVYQIIEDIEIIANGDNDHKIRRTRGFEFRRLETSIQKMVSHLKEDIISIRMQSVELDKELNKRLSAEKSLRAANHKLSLLGSITRHDMLNQITVISSGLDLLEEEIPQKKEMNYFISMIRDAISNIREMVLFSQIYEDMGVSEPVWQSLSEEIHETEKSLNLVGCIVKDKTNNLEIIADPMFDRVIFNLIENAVRHGGNVDRIEFETSISGDKCVLTMTDNGVGIPDSDKEKIFERGYGKNTGLGLFLTREILSLSGITILETGEEGHGARFDILIPKGKWRFSLNNNNS